MPSVAADSRSRPAIDQTFAAPRALKWVAIGASGLVTALVMTLSSSPIGRYLNVENVAVDYATHIDLAEDLTTRGITFPHFLWHVLVIAVHSVAPWLSWGQAGKYVVVASYGLQGALLAWIVATLVARPVERRHAFGVVALALLLVTAAPVTILTWGERALYFGYLNMDSYASPTYALLKPLALVVFVLIVKGFESDGGVRQGIALAAAVVLSALAKPSLLICLLPAALLLGGLRRLCHRDVDVNYLIAAFLLPSVAVLAWQYLSYFGSEGRSSIMFVPFQVMGYYATGLGPKFLLSILLPLTVLISYPRQVLTNAAMQLAWLQFGFAAGYSYLLAESYQTVDGNFAWSGQVATYLLYVYSTVIGLRRWTRGWRSVLCALAFSLHTVSGALFFAYPSQWGTRPAVNDVRNAALVEKVKQALAADPMVGRIPIEVEADGVIVRLTSDQTNAEERARAVEVASGVGGIWHVEDRMK